MTRMQQTDETIQAAPNKKDLRSSCGGGKRGFQRRTQMCVIYVFQLFLLCRLCLAWLPCSTKSSKRRQQDVKPSLLSAQHLLKPCSSKRPSMSLFLNDDDDYDEDYDDDMPPTVNITDFIPPKTSLSYGLGKGRSSPSQRKAMGVSGPARIHICTTCGSEFVKWMGRCPTCKEWNTLQEHVVARHDIMSGTQGRPTFLGGGSSSSSFVRSQPSWLDGIDGSINMNHHQGPIRMTDLFPKNDNDSTQPHLPQKRLVIPDDDELNTVLGGGIMRGSLTLIGGEPGVGKSTLLLQVAGSLAAVATPTPGIGMGAPQARSNEYHHVGPVWYVSGEENPEQIASRAARLGIHDSELWLLSETHVDSLCEQVVQRLSPVQEEGNRAKPPSLLIVDSIQTMVCNAGGTSAAGGITQVRESVAVLLRLSKSTGIPVILVGHVTKSGDVAGPRTVEHMVDCVLYLEGSDYGGSTNIRMLRASKNRFGSSDEVGVYEMTSGRLLPVSDPSSLFLAHRRADDDIEGSAIAIALEGRRAMTVEVQALATPAGGTSGYGRRTVDGINMSRLLLLLGVLQKRCKMYMTRSDVYINVVGRMRLDRGEGNAADLAVTVALVSSLLSIAVRSDTAFVGEIGLLGELRPISALEKRLQEARRMGFSRVVTPMELGKRYNKGKPGHKGMVTKMVNGIEWIQCATVLDAINVGLVDPIPPPRKRQRQRKSPSSNDEESFPGSLEELGLDEILDDQDDDEDFFE